MTSYAATERAALVAALRDVPADAPTLCAGWTAHDLAAHLVARERRPDSTPGLLFRALAGWTERVRAGFAQRSYPELVDLVASGPPWTSPFALPGVDAAANLTEHFVHTEDVRRAQPGWKPRDLAPGLQDEIWRSLKTRGRMLFRSAPVTLVLARPAVDGTPGERTTIAGKGPEVTLTGEPAELLLYAFGRREQALVDLSGPHEAVHAVRSMQLGV